MGAKQIMECADCCVDQEYAYQDHVILFVLVCITTILRQLLSVLTMIISYTAEEIKSHGLDRHIPSQHKNMYPP